MCVVVWDTVNKEIHSPNGECISLARPTGFEPAIFSVTGRRDRPTSLRARIILGWHKTSTY